MKKKQNWGFIDYTRLGLDDAQSQLGDFQEVIDGEEESD